MTTYPDLKNEPELLKIKTKDDQLKELQYKTENMNMRIYWNLSKVIMNLIKKYINP